MNQETQSNKIKIITTHNKKREKLIRRVILLKQVKTSRQLYFPKSIKRNIQIICEFSDQRTGKTTFYTRYNINNSFITICLLLQHKKLVEIHDDCYKNFEPKINCNFRILTAFGKDYKLTADDLKICLDEYPEYYEIPHGKEYLCAAYNKGEDGKYIINMRKKGNLPANYCSRQFITNKQIERKEKQMTKEELEQLTKQIKKRKKEEIKEELYKIVKKLFLKELRKVVRKNLNIRKKKRELTIDIKKFAKRKANERGMIPDTKEYDEFILEIKETWKPYYTYCSEVYEKDIKEKANKLYIKLWKKKGVKFKAEFKKLFKKYYNRTLEKFVKKHIKRQRKLEEQCPYRDECLAIKQFPSIEDKIKGKELIALEQKKNKTKVDKTKIKKLIVECKKTHWLILLPHSYINTPQLKNLFEQFKGEFWDEKEINTIIDESILSLSLNIINITKRQLTNIERFFNNIKRNIKDERLLNIYNSFAPFLNTLFYNIDYSIEENNRIRQLEMLPNRLVNYERQLSNQKLGNILNELLILRERDIDIFNKQLEEYIITLNSINYKFKTIPNNIFKKLIMLVNVIKNKNIDNIMDTMGVNLTHKTFKFTLDNRKGRNYIIKNSNLTFFLDAKGEIELYKWLLYPHYYKYTFYIEGEVESNFKVWTLNNKFLAQPFKFEREHYNYRRMFYTQIEGVAFIIKCLIKQLKYKKLAIAITKRFNNGKKDKERWEGKMMLTLQGSLKKKYNIYTKIENTELLDLKLIFFYSSPGKSKYEDREVLIFFNTCGLPAEELRIIANFFSPNKKYYEKETWNKINNKLRGLITDHYGIREQEQVAGRITNFDIKPKILIFLADNEAVSYYFKRHPYRSISNTLKYEPVINYLEEHKEVTTREIKNNFFPNRTIGSVRDSLNRVKNEQFVLYSKINNPQYERIIIWTLDPN